MASNLIRIKIIIIFIFLSKLFGVEEIAVSIDNVEFDVVDVLEKM